MGIPSHPEGILIHLLLNGSSSISYLMNIALFFFDFFRLFRSQSDDSEEDPVRDSLRDRFRRRVQPVRFDSHEPSCRPADCRVCFNRFEPESVVNRLSCGHLFHMVCLERWLDYHHYTCPLCRTRFLF